MLVLNSVAAINTEAIPHHDFVRDFNSVRSAFGFILPKTKNKVLASDRMQKMIATTMSRLLFSKCLRLKISDIS